MSSLTWYDRSQLGTLRTTYTAILCLRLLEVRLGHSISYSILVLERLVSFWCRGIALWCLWLALGQGQAGGQGQGDGEEDHDGCGDELTLTDFQTAHVLYVLISGN